MSPASHAPSGRLFPPHLLHARWRTFEAAGYSQPVTGVIYRGEPRPTCGMPLGGLDTGCIDIEPNGMFGYNTIFNHLVEPRALLNLPMLGLVCRDEDGTDRAWVLVSDTLGKRDTPQPAQSAVTFPPTDYAPLFDETGLAGAPIADSIDYWGHYPILDMEFNSDAPVTVGLRAWSPFIPGDTAVSMTPGAVFEIHLRNPRQRRPQRQSRLQLSRFQPARRRGRQGCAARGIERPAQRRPRAQQQPLRRLGDGIRAGRARCRRTCATRWRAQRRQGGLEPHRRPTADPFRG